MPTLWVSECSTKASAPGLRRLRFTHRVALNPCETRTLGAPGGTTFYFINDGPERGLELVESAGSRDIRIVGGADVIQQYLTMGVVEELEIALAPVLFGGGRRLFENLREPGSQFRIDRVLDGSSATHLRYVRQ